MVNTPAEDSRSTGTPTGHIPIRRFLSAPAFYNGILIGQIALANSDREYTEQDLKLVERLGELYAIAINRKRSEDELEHLASFPQLNPNPILELDAGGNVIFCNTATMDILDKAGLQGDVRVFLPPDLDALLDALKSEEEPVAFYHEVKIKGMTFDENIHLSKKHRVLRIYAFDITERKRAENALQESHARLVNNLEQIEASLASIAVMRDPYTAGHQVRVASLACAIAAEIGTPVERIGAIRTAAMLHDIGKIFVPQEMLNRPVTRS
jgi:PAS domain-containing protein